MATVEPVTLIVLFDIPIPEPAVNAFCLLFHVVRSVLVIWAVVLAVCPVNAALVAKVVPLVNVRVLFVKLADVKALPVPPVDNDKEVPPVPPPVADNTPADVMDNPLPTIMPPNCEVVAVLTLNVPAVVMVNPVVEGLTNPNRLLVAIGETSAVVAE